MNVFRKFKGFGAWVVLALVSMLTVGTASAQTTGTDVGTTVSTAIAAVNPQIVEVIAAMAAALVIIVAWQLVKKAFSGK